MIKIWKYRTPAQQIPASNPALWSEYLATDPEVPGLIPNATRFSEK
jgi:hypothetical protein